MRLTNDALFLSAFNNLGRWKARILFIVSFLFLTSIVYFIAIVFYPVSRFAWFFILITYYESAYSLRNKLSLSVKELFLITVGMLIFMWPLGFVVLVFDFIGRLGGLPITYDILMLHFCGYFLLNGGGLLLLLLFSSVIEKREDLRLWKGYLILSIMIFLTMILTIIHGSMISDPLLVLAMKTSNVYYPLSMGIIFLLANVRTNRRHLIVMVITLLALFLFFLYNRTGFNPYETMQAHEVLWSATFVLFSVTSSTLVRNLLR